ncbi:MAG: toxic anion resistance protein [Eubacteriales bacterium]|nr:toxic anion resistance protein [Clostridiales bacterium]MDD7300567.1 toxic anion resistance protein [Eubacteriales bacterium]MDY4433700.1 toxic anion resistance protein [Candidatus Flemingibacterium sp.]
MDNNNMMPELTLTPFADKPVEKPAEPEVPAAQDAEKDLGVTLTPEEKKMVADFAAKIDITDPNIVLQYGAGSQQKIANFSDSALQNVKTKDLGEVGDMITSLVGELRDFEDDDSTKGFLGFFKKQTNKLEQMKTKYDKVDVNVEKIATALEDHQVKLMKDVAVLDQLYNVNLANFKELSMYIVAGKQKLEEVRANELPALIEKAKQSNLPEDTQAANDMAAMCNRFEKKIHDLELTRAISIQMAPQIRLIQNNDTVMSEKIQTTLVNTIPLWKSQMVIALGLAHSQQALKAQQQVTDLTNELLKKNAEALKISTIETAKASERGIVDIETLKQTNETLISTLDEVVQIQNDGRAKRKEAEAELARIEDQLKNKLLTIKG